MYRLFCVMLIYLIPLAAYEDYFIVFLVNARHLDYSGVNCLMKTIAKHPSDGSKNRDVGHAWIYLKGPNGIMEGGHSGETGLWQPKYMDGVFDNAALGSANAISYLWSKQCDGFFQKGNGGHKPTCAAKVAITEAQGQEILDFIRSYPFQEYALTGKQCTSFVREIGAIIGLQLADLVTVPINSTIRYKGCLYRLWSDLRYSQITFASPDRLERSLQELIARKKAENVLRWYFKTRLQWKALNPG